MTVFDKAVIEYIHYVLPGVHAFWEAVLQAQIKDLRRQRNKPPVKRWKIGP